MSVAAKEDLVILPMDQVHGWDAFVQSHPDGAIFHTQEMVTAIGNTPGYEPLAIAAVRPDGQIVGLLVATKVSLAGAFPDLLSARSVMPAQPIVVPGPCGSTAMNRLLLRHDRVMRDQVVFSEIRPITRGDCHGHTIKNLGYEHFEYHNYELDLRQGSDSIFANMNRMRRGNIRSNQRRGLTVREADPQQELCIFYHHLATSYKRSQVPLVDSQHFKEVFQRLPRSSYRLTFAELDGRPIASACHLIFKGRVYWWQAGTERIAGITAQASLVWDAIQWAIERGESVYDFAGAGWGDEVYGPGVFKARFGGRHLNVGRYRKVYSTLRMKVAGAGYRIARPLFPGKPR